MNILWMNTAARFSRGPRAARISKGKNHTELRHWHSVRPEIGCGSAAI
jgi:hypothetical protein